MERKIKELIEDLKKQGFTVISGKPNPEEKVNVWYVIAKLEEILLDAK